MFRSLIGSEDFAPDYLVPDGQSQPGTSNYAPDFVVDENPEIIVKDFARSQEPTTSIDIEAQFRKPRRKTAKKSKKPAKKSKAKAKKSKAKAKKPGVCRSKKGRYMKCRKGQRRA
jgi:outer membrane biosynthesis protein TonB